MYWKKFYDNEEKRLIRVRDFFPKLSYLPIIPNLRDSETNFCDIADFNTSSALQGLDKNVLLVDSKFSSSTTSDTSLRQDNEQICPSTEPIVKISPPTPLKKSPKIDAVAITESAEDTEHTSTADIKNKSMMKKDLREEPESLDVPPKNSIMPHDGSGIGKVYSKKTCPFHKHEPAVKIFDDDIEKYLSDDPRASVLLEHKLPLLSNTSKYDKIKSKTTFAENKKIKRNAFPQKELAYYPDNIIDLAAKEIAKVKSKTKENDALDKQRNLKSDVLIPNLKFSVDKRSIKKKNDLKIVSLFPKLYHSQNRIKVALDKSIAKFPKSHKYLKTSAVQKNVINKSE